ncbi:hypothetical protein BGX26_005904, partial [Mortierella sp. AD094]
MGMFINTLPFRIDLDDTSVLDSVYQTHTDLAVLLEHEHSSLTLAQRCSSVPAGTPLFSAILNYRHNSALSSENQNLTGINFLESHERTNYPFMMSVEDGGVSLGLTAQVVQPFDSSRICGYMQQALQSLADVLGHSPNIPVQKLEILTAEERELLLHTWNITSMPYPHNLCMHQLFESQVAQSPDAIALVYEDQSLTYSELNVRANTLAHHLIHLGVKPDSLVAICVSRSLAMIIGLLAILKAGGAYVPLDPHLPRERLHNIFVDASPLVLLADDSGIVALGSPITDSVLVVDPNVLQEMPTVNPHVSYLTPRNLIYVMYTSGSTGNPKGVMVEHAQVTRLLDSTAAWYNFNESDTWIMTHTFSFDVSVWEMWGALRHGGKLIIPPYRTTQSPEDLYGLVCSRGVTVLNLTPSAFRPLIRLQNHTSLRDKLRYIILAGEALEPATLRTWYAIRSDTFPKVVNMYGPTETLHATYRLMTAQDCHLTFSPIGVRIPDLTVYVLDTHGHPVPLGAIGELCISGAGVTRGYLNRPELTSEKFPLDPFTKEEGARMYKTGDLVRYLQDGNLVFLGRNDHQVKIRGFRIETGEIEARLVEHPLISETVVVALGTDSDKRLVAYVVADAVDHLAQLLRNHLTPVLPEYMIPAAFVCLDALPMTPNGKLDRRALPEPERDAFASQDYEKPQGEIETALAAIWADLLKIERIGRHDNFFMLGGHSLLAVRLMNRVSALGVHLQLSTLFESPTLSELANALASQFVQENQSFDPITPISRNGALPLSFAQQRLWFLAQMEGVSDAYHIPMAIRLQGMLNRDAWQSALNTMFARHESLRSTFINIEGQPQVLLLPAELGLPMLIHDLRGELDIEGQIHELTKLEAGAPFNFEKGPLIRSRLIQVADDDHVILLTQHHIVSDGWSMGLLIRELSEIYTAYCSGQPNPLPLLKIQYPDYASWQRDWLSGGRLQEQ